MNQANLANLATVLVVVVVVLIGGVITIVHPETLAFDQYIKDCAIALGLLAVGRGINPGTGV